MLYRIQEGHTPALSAMINLSKCIWTTALSKYRTFYNHQDKTPVV